MTALRNSLDLHSPKYEKILILGDFNVEIEEANMKSLCENYNLKSLIKQPTCYKYPNKPTCIDLILTNVPRMLLMAVTVMRNTFKKKGPRVINYRPYRYFSSETFRVSLINDLSNEVFVNNDDG